MSGIVINIDPVIFSVGGFSLRWYSLAVIGAILAAVMLAVREGGRRGIPREEIYSLALWVVLAGIIGARLFHVLDRLDYYGENLADIFSFQQGGLAIWGGVAGGVSAGVLYGRIRGLPLLRLGDAVVPAVLLGQIIGRLGCIINGDAYGGPTYLPWGFIYTHPEALLPDSLRYVPTHPYPVYEILWNLTLLLLLWRLRGRFRVAGSLFFAYLFFYSLGRFFLSYVRQEAVFLWGLQQAQVLALLGLVISLVALGVLRQRRKAA
jgi:phosphatidylglycerol:prolipoprotein diacylglycerol transferase